MAMQDIAAAMQRVEAALRRRPELGPHDDDPAVSRWQGDLRVVSSHANGTQVETDMPKELGGSGGGVTAGWLMRAGLASCLATRIAMSAAAAGIELATLEVTVASRSNVRGLLGVGAGAGPIGPGPFDVELAVRIGAKDVAASRLRALVEESDRCSPVPDALRNTVPVAVRVDIVVA